MDFDPNGPAVSGNIFGLPHTEADAEVVIIPVPYDATTSAEPGAADGPSCVLEASMQVDLYDHRFGRIYERGIWMDPIPDTVRHGSDDARCAADCIFDALDAGETPPSDAIATLDKTGEMVNRFVDNRVREVLASGKAPVVLGGEHSVPFAAIRACAEHIDDAEGGSEGELGILQIDAHFDLRPAYLGMRWSHASIMHNVLAEIPQVRTIVAVGIRDYGENELDASRRAGPHGGVVRTHFAEDIADDQARGLRFIDRCREIVEELPEHVYVTVDIDGLSPEHCPNTGTPVPGGLSYAELSLLLETLRDSGKRVVGADLVEVSPPRNEDGRAGAGSIDGNVGARVLYRLCGLVRTPEDRS